MPILKRKNENFFKRWTSQMAYVVGFFAADGNLTKGKRGNHYIEFTSTDRDIIEKIKEVMELGHRIGSKRRTKRWKERFRIQIGSKEIFNDLVRLGFIPNKSMKLAYPAVPPKYRSDFIRGYFDGDGHVTMGSYKRKGRPSRNRILFSGFTCGTKNFLKKLHKYLRSVKVIHGGTFYAQDNYYRLNFSIKDSVRLYYFLYKNLNNSLYLARKKKVFEVFMRA